MRSDTNKNIWVPIIEEILFCEQELHIAGNEEDRFAVASRSPAVEIFGYF